MLERLWALVVRRVFKLSTFRRSAAGIEPIRILVLREREEGKKSGGRDIGAAAEGRREEMVKRR